MNIELNCTLMYCILQCSAVRCGEVRCGVVKCSVAHLSAVSCSAVECRTVLEKRDERAISCLLNDEGPTVEEEEGLADWQRWRLTNTVGNQLLISIGLALGSFDHYIYCVYGQVLLVPLSYKCNDFTETLLLKG